MGVNYGPDVHHRLSRLKRRHVRKIATGLAQDYGLSTPAIDFDCSNVAFKGGKNPVWLAQFLVGWARLGLQVTPVCDASTRPQSKQASNKRRAVREKKRIKAAVLRAQLREDRMRLIHGSLPQAERDQLREDIKKKEKACKSADTGSTNFVPPDLAEQFERELEQSNAHITNEINGVVNRVQVA